MGDDVSKDKYDAKATYTADAGNCELKVVKGKTQTAELSGVYGVMKVSFCTACTYADLARPGTVALFVIRLRLHSSPVYRMSIWVHL